MGYQSWIFGQKMKISNSVSKGSWTAKISLFLSGFFRWNSTSQKVPLSIEIELWGRVSKTVLMSYSEKSPGYLAQMQNWPSVWPKNSWGAGDGQQQTFSFLLWDILGFDYGVIKEFNSTSHSPTHQSPSKKYEQQSSYQVRRISEGFFADFQKRTLLKRAWERYCKMKFWPNFDNLEV